MLRIIGQTDARGLSEPSSGEKLTLRTSAVDADHFSMSVDVHRAQGQQTLPKATILADNSLKLVWPVWTVAGRALGMESACLPPNHNACLITVWGEPGSMQYSVKL